MAAQWRPPCCGTHRHGGDQVSKSMLVVDLEPLLVDTRECSCTFTQVAMPGAIERRPGSGGAAAAR